MNEPCKPEVHRSPTARGRLSALATFIFFCLVALSSWGYTVLQDRRQTALTAAQDVAECRRLAERITTLRNRPAVAGSQELQQATVAKRVEKAAGAYGIPAAELVRISPEAARRVGDTPYLEKPTQLLLRQITLRQLVGFLHELSNGDEGLQVTELRMTVPRQQDAGTQWTAEVTVSYWIYAPRSDANRAGEL